MSITFITVCYCHFKYLTITIHQTDINQFQLLTKAARDMANTENQMQNSEENLKKMQLIAIHMGYQYENILKSAQMLTEVQEQLAAMKR